MVVLSSSNEPSLNQFILPPTFLNTGPKPVSIPEISLYDPDAPARITRACEELGFFKVINHGVPIEMVDNLEHETMEFFKLSQGTKEKAGNPRPFGYGNKRIGLNGDVGWVEYLLVSADPEFIDRVANALFPDNPHIFSSAINKYISKMKEMGEQVLEMMAQGLGIEDKRVFSRFIKDEKSDSYFRLNHYPPCPELKCALGALGGTGKTNLVGFDEHTDPQIISILRSNNTAGFEISLPDGTWVSVPPDPNSFFINVGDSLQVMTNGRFKSVKHRVFADYTKSRISMIYFGGPPLCEKIAPLPCILQPGEDCLYEEFTWREYKQAAYKTRLSDNRLTHFTKRLTSESNF